MKFRKIAFLGLILFLLMVDKSSMAQDVLYVTDTILENSSGSLDSVLLRAKPLTDAGHDVTILFSAPGLCQIDGHLPVISITRGSLTLKKDSLISYEQGIQFINFSGFFINASASTSIVFDSLSMKADIYSDDFCGIYISNSTRITIKNCIFDNNNGIFYNNRSVNLLIENNIFRNNKYAIRAICGSDIDYQTSSTIVNNNFINSISWSSSSFAVGFEKNNVSLNNFKINHLLTIRNNEINGYPDVGIEIYNSYGESHVMDDTTFKVNITKNNIESNGAGIWFVCPYPRFVVDSNVFTNNVRHLLLEDRAVVPEINPYGLDFIGENTCGLSHFNASNIFNASTSSFQNTGYFGKGVNIVGQNLQSEITISNGKYSNIRETRIKSTYPISLGTTNSIYGNYNISPPTLNAITKSGSSITVKYRLNGSQQHLQANAGFVTEFFKSNKNGHLLEFLGSHTVNTLTGNEYKAVLNFPSGVVPDTIVATVTSLGNQPKSTNKIGTSPASEYKTVMIGCYNGELSFCFPEQICSGEKVSVTNNSTNRPYGSNVFMWNYGDGSQSTYDTTHIYASAGNYTVKLISPAMGSCPRDTVSKVIVVNSCSHECKDCIASFAPEPGKKYVLSAWVQENGAAPSKTAYTYATIQLSFLGSSQVLTFAPKGVIIDGWQRIEEEFSIPDTATDIQLKLISAQGDCYFDDIRVFPFDGTMKSYVYDPISLRLVSELDEHNYATFYEYDEEGKLVRVKKETERGVMTIKENKNSTIKK